MISKKILLLICTLSLLNTFTANIAATENKENDSQMYIEEEGVVPQGATILYETEQNLYLNSVTGEFEADAGNVQSKGKLYQINCKHTWYQMSGRKIDVAIRVQAVDPRAQIKSIVGSHKMSDTQSYAANYSEISAYAALPVYVFSAYATGLTSFTKGHKIKCTVNYYISLVNGSVLNGGKVSSTEYITIK